MDAEWELVERSTAINALAVHDATRADMEAAKCEGNAFFQRQLFADAVHKYTLVVDWCIAQRVARGGDPDGTLAALEVAVRLNRALAHIEQKEFGAAESDCTTVLNDRSDCVKALYRRALAREQLGNTQGALGDLGVLLEYEPMNPAALTLLARLRTHEAPSSAPPTTAVAAITSGMRECSFSRGTTDATHARVELAAAAEQAWRALQDEEFQVRQTFKSKKSSMASVPKKTRQSSKNSATTPVSASKNQEEHERTAFKCKTNGEWESLAQEELRTVAKVFGKRRTSEPQCES